MPRRRDMAGTARQPVGPMYRVDTSQRYELASLLRKSGRNAGLRTGKYVKVGVGTWQERQRSPDAAWSWLQLRNLPQTAASDVRIARLGYPGAEGLSPCYQAVDMQPRPRSAEPDARRAHGDGTRRYVHLETE
jgi:hypothetical protein